ncbi:MAG: hypothetical protein EOP34_03755 [Rickettsiales bacterium]|nr:MAG: hypothetical protein EOP34_03755 [Rickettsiales bacterium]
MRLFSFRVNQVLHNMEVGIIRTIKGCAFSFECLSKRPCFVKQGRFDARMTEVYPLSRERGPGAFEKISDTTFSGQFRDQYMTQPFFITDSSVVEVQVRPGSKFAGVVTAENKSDIDFLEIFEDSCVAKLLSEDTMGVTILKFVSKEQPIRIYNK